MKGLNAARARMVVYDQVKTMEEEWKDTLEHEMVTDNQVRAPTSPVSQRVSPVIQAVTASSN